MEGKIYYVSEEYKPTFSSHIRKNMYGDQFMTGNISYKRIILESARMNLRVMIYTRKHDAVRVNKLMQDLCAGVLRKQVKTLEHFFEYVGNDTVIPITLDDN